MSFACPYICPGHGQTRTPVQMGAMHTDMNTDNRTRTVKEWADIAGVKPDTARVQIKRRLSRTVGLNSVLTADEWAQVYVTKPVQNPYKPAPTKQDKSVLTQNPVADNGLPPGNTKAEPVTLPELSTVRGWTVDVLLISLAIGHAALIWYELATTYGMYGTIGGGVVFGFIFATVLLAADRTKSETSTYALFFAAIIDIAAIFLHYDAFHPFGAPEHITVAVCAFLGGMSWGALFLFRHQKNY